MLALSMGDGRRLAIKTACCWFACCSAAICSCACCSASDCGCVMPSCCCCCCCSIMCWNICDRACSVTPALLAVEPKVVPSAGAAEVVADGDAKWVCCCCWWWSLVGVVPQAAAGAGSETAWLDRLSVPKSSSLPLSLAWVRERAGAERPNMAA